MPRSLTTWGRALTFYLLVAFMVGGPTYRQIFHGKNPLFRNWIMFKGMGLGVVDAKFYISAADGSRKSIDRLKILGFGPGQKIPKNIFRIRNRKGVLEVARLLCQKLGPGTDVRAETRWSTRQGWKIGFQGKENLCTLAPTPGRQKSRRSP